MRLRGRRTPPASEAAAVAVAAEDESLRVLAVPQRASHATPNERPGRAPLGLGRLVASVSLAAPETRAADDERARCPARLGAIPRARRRVLSGRSRRRRRRLGLGRGGRAWRRGGRRGS